MNLKDTITRRAATGGIAAVLLAIASDGAGAKPKKKGDGKAGTQHRERLSDRERRRRVRQHRRFRAWMDQATCCLDGQRVLDDGTCGNGATTIPCGDLLERKQQEGVMAWLNVGPDPCTPGCEEAAGWVPTVATDIDGMLWCRLGTDGPWTGWQVCAPVHPRTANEIEKKRDKDGL